MCGDDCLDLAADRRNCGGCGRACPRGEACEDGLCSGEAAEDGVIAAAMEWGTQISPGKVYEECTQDMYDGFNEAYPERTITPDTNTLYAAFNRSEFGGPQPGKGEYYSVSDGNISPSWGAPPPVRGVPVQGNFYTGNDPWATTSGHQLEYFSFILNETAATNRTCIGIGAATTSQLRTGNWSRRVQCANTLDEDFDDGPAIHYDLGAPRLWAVAKEQVLQAVPPGYNICGPGSGSNTGVCLYLYSPCNGGAPWPDTPDCPMAFQKKVTGSITGHATVIASPVTHNGIVAYRTAGVPPLIQLQIFTAAGLQVGQTFTVRSSPYGETSDCASGCGQPGNGTVPKCGGCNPDCGAVNECPKLVSKPHLAVKHDTATNRVYLYIAYDQLCSTTGPDGVMHMKACVEIVEITNELTPQRRGQYCSSSCANTGSNEFASNVSMTANTYSGGDTLLGNFYYQQPSVAGFPDACNTIYTGTWGTGYVPNGMHNFGVIGGPFPTMTFQTARGMGDYAAAVRRGLTGYWFYPTWAQPVRIIVPGVPCETCLGDEYNLAIFGRRVKP